MTPNPIEETRERSPVPVCPTSQLPDGEAVRVLSAAGPIAVYNVEGTYYATADTCTHAESSLAEEGFLENDVVECGAHFAKFCVRTGAVLEQPATKPLRVFDVEVVDDHVTVLV